MVFLKKKKILKVFFFFFAFIYIYPSLIRNFWVNYYLPVHILLLVVSEIPCPCLFMKLLKEEFEDTKEVIRIRISKKNRQHNGQKKKYKRTNNDLQNITHKTKDPTNTNLTKKPWWTQVTLTLSTIHLLITWPVGLYTNEKSAQMQTGGLYL